MLLQLALTGCGPATAPTAPVSGTVLYQGKPLPTGTVMFTPTDGGPPAYGEIDAEGKYSLMTFEEGDGAVLGSHTIAISAVVVPETGVPEAQTLLPFKYSSGQTSGLTAEVTEQEMNVVDLDLQ